jgi:hypothetical protein
MKERVLPWLEDFQPDLVFVSAGFDALGIFAVIADNMLVRANLFCSVDAFIASFEGSVHVYSHVFLENSPTVSLVCAFTHLLHEHLNHQFLQSSSYFFCSAFSSRVCPHGVVCLSALFFIFSVSNGPPRRHELKPERLR